MKSRKKVNKGSCLLSRDDVHKIYREKSQNGFQVMVRPDRVVVRQCDDRVPSDCALRDYSIQLPRVCYMDARFAELLGKLDLGANDVRAVWGLWSIFAQDSGWLKPRTASNAGTVSLTDAANHCLRLIALYERFLSPAQRAWVHEQWEAQQAERTGA